MGMCMSVVIVIHKALTYVFSSLNYQFMQKYIFVNCGLDALLLSYVINTKFELQSYPNYPSGLCLSFFHWKLSFQRKKECYCFNAFKFIVIFPVHCLSGIAWEIFSHSEYKNTLQHGLWSFQMCYSYLCLCSA